MRFLRQRGWRCTAVSPRGKTALCGVLVGAGLSLVLVAAPLWFVGGGVPPVAVSPAPLAALSTTPAQSSQFNISNLLVGDWVGEMCPDNGEPVGVHFEFLRDHDNELYYSVTIDGAVHSSGVLGRGACDVDGEEVVLHEFLAMLSDCDEACGVDRAYEGHFEEGTLVGTYTDAADDELCSSCVGGGTWWLEPATG